jgi:hypothetical protein
MNLNKALGAGIVLLMAFTANALLGGFGVSTKLPDQNDPCMKDAVLIVQPVGCHGPGSSVTARAEGFENGLRRSIPIKLHLLPGKASVSAGDAFMVKRQWPAKGSWVLVFTAKKDGMHADAIVKLDRKGEVLVMDNPQRREPTVLADGKTQILPWSFIDDQKVVAMYVVHGDLKAAVDYTLRSNGS